MKKNIIIALIVALVVVTSTHNLIGQNWHWEWAKNTNNNTVGPFLDILHADFYNNYYFRGGYSTSINFPDTSFSHNGNSYTSNYVIAKYNIHGKFKQAIDFYTLPGNHIHYPEVFTDNEMNIYVAGSFQVRIFFQDTLLNHCNTPYTFQPDIFVVKLNPDYEVVWADIIGGTLQDNLNGFIISENDDIFIATEHYAGTQWPTTVSFFGQDTAYSEKDFISVLRMDKDKNIVWRNEFQGWVSGNLFLGGDNNIHYQGKTWYNIIIGGDTLHNPYNPNDYVPPFIISYNQDGELLKASLIDNGIYIYDMEINSDGDYLVSGQIVDTLFVEQDTIIVPPDYTFYIITKLNNYFEPTWYQIVEEGPNQEFGSVRIKRDQDNLIFMANAVGEIQICDTTLNLGNHYGKIIGELDINGQLINIKTIIGTNDVFSYYPFIDNCSNLVLGGSFKWQAYFDNDTIYAFSNYEYDGFIAKLLRSEPGQVDLGPDTTVCAEYILTGPEGYQFYLWNDSLTNQNWFSVTESGTYFFACANEDGCWFYDTINITIHPGFEIELGADTTIKKNDTIILSVPNQYESYLWSDGSTSTTITIIGYDYGVGEFKIWVEVTDGPCVVSDTVYLTVKSEFGIDEIVNNKILIFPNPANKNLIVSANNGIVINEVKIYNYMGRLTQDYKLDSREIDISDLPAGIYIVEVTANYSKYRKKLIIE